MEEQLNPLAITHLLQHALRSLCIHENSQWVYAVFWRILPRNYPPPKWDLHGGAFERSRGNRRNWILVWEDGFCNFAASSGGQVGVNCADSSAAYPHCEPQLTKVGLQPDLFFKMSHEIYNYGEGLIGKVAADHTHKWVFKEGQDQEVNFLTSWQNPADSHPRTWEAQFQSGIKTIALIAVKEGVVQLGALNKVKEDLSYVVLVRKRFSYLESIPGFLLPHPSSSPPATFPLKIDECNPPENWAFAPPTTTELYSHSSPQLGITPSMRSLEDLLSKLPSIVPMQSLASPGYYSETPPIFFSPGMSPEVAVGMIGRVAKEKVDEESCGHEREVDFAGDNSSGSSSLSFHCFNVTKPSEGL